MRKIIEFTNYKNYQNENDSYFQFTFAFQIYQ